jgi:hypothetical protein
MKDPSEEEEEGEEEDKEKETEEEEGVESYLMPSAGDH